MPVRPSYWLLLLSLSALPWYVVRFAVAGVPMTLVELLILFTFGLWIVEELWAGRFRSWSKLGREISGVDFGKWWILAGLLFFGGATISVGISPETMAALGIYKAYIVEPLLVGIVIWSVVRSEKAWWGIVGALALSMVQIIGLVFTQEFMGWPNFAPAEMRQGRPSAVYNTANAVGLYLGPLLLLVAGAGLGLMQSGFRARGWLTVGLAIAGLVAVLFSESMGAIIAMGACLLLLFGFWLVIGQGQILGLIKRFAAPAAVLLIALYGISTIGYVWWFNHPPQVANPYTRPDFTTMTIRQCTWEGTRLALEDAPLGGLGLAGFTTSYLAHATCDAEPFVYPHNMVLNAWAETGMTGLLAFGLMGVLWLLTAWKLMLDPSVLWRWIGAGLSLGLLYWLIHGLVDVPYFKNDLSVLWWVLVALLLSAFRLRRTSATSRT